MKIFIKKSQKINFIKNLMLCTVSIAFGLQNGVCMEAFEQVPEERARGGFFRQLPIEERIEQLENRLQNGIDFRERLAQQVRGNVVEQQNLARRCQVLENMCQTLEEANRNLAASHQNLLPLLKILIVSQNDPNWQFPEDFNGATYLLLQPEISSFATTLNLEEQTAVGKWHYTHFGRAANKPYLPQDFNGVAYVSLYNYPTWPGMQNAAATLNPEQRETFGRCHYAHCGRTEGRLYKFPEDFNTATYLSLYPALLNDGHIAVAEQAGINARANPDGWAKYHYTRFRNPVLPGDFDGATYFSLYTRPGYPGFQYIDPGFQHIAVTRTPTGQVTWARWHYAHHGRAEGRRYR